MGVPPFRRLVPAGPGTARRRKRRRGTAVPRRWGWSCSRPRSPRPRPPSRSPAATPDTARAVTSLPAATLPPADALRSASITALPLASQARDGDGDAGRPLVRPAAARRGDLDRPDPRRRRAALHRRRRPLGRPGCRWTRTPASGTAPRRVPRAAGPTRSGSGTARQVEVRATRGGAPVTQGLAVQRIDPGTSANDDAIGARARERDSAARSGAPPAPAYVTRAQWGADPKLMTWPPQYAATTRAVTIHHTAESNDYTPEQSAAIVRGIYAYHSRKNGWGDIGYNALVDKYGTIFEGRAGGMDRPVVAAHAGGFNQETFGIAMMGTLTDTPPTPAELTSVERLAAWKLGGTYRDPSQKVTLTSAGGGTSKFAKGQTATVDALFAHRDVGNTECPGNAGLRRDGHHPRRDGQAHRRGGHRRALGVGRRIPTSASPTASSSRPRTAARRFTDFEHGSIYWSPATGAHEVSRVDPRHVAGAGGGTVTAGAADRGRARRRRRAGPGLRARGLLAGPGLTRGPTPAWRSTRERGSQRSAGPYGRGRESPGSALRPGSRTRSPASGTCSRPGIRRWTPRRCRSPGSPTRTPTSTPRSPSSTGSPRGSPTSTPSSCGSTPRRGSPGTARTTTTRGTPRWSRCWPVGGASRSPSPSSSSRSGAAPGSGLEPVGMPGHFLVHPRDSGWYLDPFTGDLLGLDECEALFRASTGVGPRRAVPPRAARPRLDPGRPRPDAHQPAGGPPRGGPGARAALGARGPAAAPRGGGRRDRRARRHARAIAGTTWRRPGCSTTGPERLPRDAARLARHARAWRAHLN